MLGQEVEVLTHGYKDAGTYELNWTANKLSSGIYLYKLQSNSVTITKKMTLLK